MTPVYPRWGEETCLRNRFFVPDDLGDRTRRTRLGYQKTSGTPDPSPWSLTFRLRGSGRSGDWGGEWNSYLDDRPHHRSDRTSMGDRKSVYQSDRPGLRRNRVGSSRARRNFLTSRRDPSPEDNPGPVFSRSVWSGVRDRLTGGEGTELKGLLFSTTEEDVSCFRLTPCHGSPTPSDSGPGPSSLDGT